MHVLLVHSVVGGGEREEVKADSMCVCVCVRERENARARARAAKSIETFASSLGTYL